MAYSPRILLWRSCPLWIEMSPAKASTREFRMFHPHRISNRKPYRPSFSSLGTRGVNPKNAWNCLSVGLFAPNMEAEVVDWVNRSFMPPTKTRKLLLCRPGLVKGYLNIPEATMSTIDEENWLHIGDFVYFGGEGYLYVVDCLKEVITYKGF